MSATGRFRTGTHRTADGRELSEAVRGEEIRALLRRGDTSYAEIAAAYRVSRAAVAGIAHRMRKAGGFARPPSKPGVRKAEPRPEAKPEPKPERRQSAQEIQRAQRRAAIKALAKAGLTTKQIAERLGVEVSSVHKLAHRAGVSLNGRAGRKPVSDEVRDAIIQAVREGATAKEAGARFKVAASTAQVLVSLARADGLLPPLWNAPAPVSAEVRRDVVARLKAGEKLLHVAKLHGLSRTTVETIRKHARAAGELMAPTGVPDDPQAKAALVERVVGLARNGLNGREIAALVGASRQWVASTCKAAGVALARDGSHSSAVPWTNAERQALRGAARLGMAAVMKAVAAERPDEFMAARTHSEINREANAMGIVIAAAAPQMAPPGAGVRFDDLAPHGCRWPLGLGPDGQERFCGAARDAGATGGRARYCAAHGAQATVRAATSSEAKQIAGAGW